MRNHFIDAGTKDEIDRIVDRLHRDLSLRHDRVDLAEVRQLLKLDLAYYSTSDPGLADEVVHKLRLGAKQLLEMPSKLREVVTRFDLSALFIPARKRIVLNTDLLPDTKLRWAESHEIAHSVFSWHQEFMLGDTQLTLSPACHEQIEAEANYGGGRLLYPHHALTELARSSPPSMAHVKAIASHFGNSITSALWRLVELSDIPCLGIVGAHPRRAKDADAAVTYFIRSPSFAQQFAGVLEGEIFQVLRSFCSYKLAGPLGTHEFMLTDENGEQHMFLADCFGNTHRVLTLVTYKSKLTSVAIAL